MDVLYLLNEGAEINDMLGGSYDFKQFKGRLDVATAAIMGHSFGGATTVQTLSEDTRFKWVIAPGLTVICNVLSLLTGVALHWIVGWYQ